MGNATLSARRVWRLRKLHQSVDAELRPCEPGGVELLFLLNGEVSYRQHWPSASPALEAAARKRAELERDGWVFHW